VHRRLAQQRQDRGTDVAAAGTVAAPPALERTAEVAPSWASASTEPAVAVPVAMLVRMFGVVVATVVELLVVIVMV
jgi:hypothetical protein